MVYQALSSGSFDQDTDVIQHRRCITQHMQKYQGKTTDFNVWPAVFNQTHFLT